jgi:hypothetical protein
MLICAIDRTEEVLRMASGSKLARRCVVVLTMAMVIAPGLASAAQSAQTMQLNGPCPQYGVNRTYGGGWGSMVVDRSALIVQGSAFASFGLFGG